MDKYMKEMVQKIMALGNIKCVAWHLKLDDRPEWSWLAVRVEDDNGQVVEIVRHTWEINHRQFEGIEDVLVNLLIAKCRVHGQWVGVTCDLKEAVEGLRKAFPYVGIFFVNEHDLNQVCGWTRPEYVW